MSKLSDTDFKAAIVTMFQEVRAVEMNGKTEVLRKETRVMKKESNKF